MLGGIVKKLFGTKHERQMKKLRPEVEAINALEPSLESLSDDELKAKTGEFRQQLENGAPLDDLLIESFAVVREASKRTTGMRHYDVQMVGGIGMHRGLICEMRTGEGKTLGATSALYLNALEGRGAHLITVNDYLASRDAEWMGEIYGFLGMSVGTIVHGLFHGDRQRSYRCDITYGTNNEFGFDYLRDNMKETIEKYVQRDLHYAIVDEVDSILIDEARTPLIISGESDKAADFYLQVDAVVPAMRKDLDYVVDEKAHSVQLTDSGVDRIERLLECTNLYSPENNELLHHVNQGLRAHTLYKKDVSYLVEGNEVLIVDEFTGRKMEGRRWSDGLHQAIEAKEGVPIQPESRTLATITYQNYFRMYRKLAGMTGTAETESAEFHKIYDLGVMVIPPNRVIIRDDADDLVYKNERGKFRAIVDEIRERHEKGQPVLVGTTSVEKSNVIHQLLEREKIPHNVLNAKQHGREATVVAQAGRKHAVTVSTNMAGRGTDIILGGNPEMMARSAAEGNFDPEDEPEKFEKLFAGLREQCEAEKKEVLAAGGLHILGTERHESRRIDNQLRGRAGRQGDPGSSQFFLSLEDDLMRIFNADRITGLMERLGMEEDVPIEASIVNRAIENAQQKVEAMHFDTRKNLFEYDNVMNEQRKAIYLLRRQILEGRYRPEILDDKAREEQGRKLPEPPKESGPHTIESLSKRIDEDIRKIIKGNAAALIEEGAEASEADPDWPKDGVKPEGLTHELYRHYGAMVRFDDIAKTLDPLVKRAKYEVSWALIQQRERLHDLAYEWVSKSVAQTCPADVHPDEWEVEELETLMLERFHVKFKLRDIPENLEDLVEDTYKTVETMLELREKEFGLTVYTFHLRRMWLREIDEQWIAHLKNVEHLRTGIGLVGYATRDPKNEYKIRGFNLFKEMWEGIEQTVLDKVLTLELTEEEKLQAKEGAEYETALTRGLSRSRGGSARQAAGKAQLDKLQQAARRAMEQLKSQTAAAQTVDPAKRVEEAAARAAKGESTIPSARPNDPCPCGSGKRYKKCHGKQKAATATA
ncbi:MAG: preprotein translocase subunit SecA [Nannocystaceae bacterium]|nr:preprotein translocase subunit SecA [Nannocystaceae bacterium]